MLTAGDHTEAEETQFTLIPSWPRSNAMHLVIETMAPLLAEYVHRFGSARWAELPLTFTMVQSLPEKIAPWLQMDRIHDIIQN
jgi:hypothetical protein